jgi:hypothetical protein
MKRNSLIVAAAALLVCFGATAQIKNKPLRFDSEKWNFGNVDSRSGKVSHTFSFTNTGSETMVIKTIISSCGCTTTDYTRQPIKPGGKGRVDVSFDPAAFEAGPFSKDIYVSLAGVPNSNTLTVEGTVVVRRLTVEQEYPHATAAGLRFSSPTADFLYVEHGKPDTVRIGYANTLSQSVELAFDVAPANNCISVAAPETVCAECRGEIVIVYSAARGSRLYGHTYNRIYSVIDGRRQEPAIVASAIVTDNFEGSDMNTAPRAGISPSFYHFGAVNRGEKKSREFVLTNDGSSTLTVKQVEHGPGASATLKAGTQIKAGRSVKFISTLDTSVASQSAVTIITDDPARPMREVRLISEVR